MKYEYIEVYLYERIAVSGHDFLRIDFVNKIQLLLGTNGSGKSSLMKEISVLPSNPAEYKQGGYSERGVTMDGHTYVIRSDFTKGARHSFIKDGVELNPGGTATVGRALALKEFGITPEIHSINCGITNFHTMDVADRRNWFTRIGREDYTYALSYFKKLKDYLRELQVLLKHAKAKLFTDKNNLISEEKKVELSAELRQANLALDKILARKVSIDNDEDYFWSALETQQDEIEGIYQKIMRLHNQHFKAFSMFGQEEELFEKINTIRTDLGGIGLKINLLTQDVEQTRKIIERFADVKDVNEEEARSTIQTLETEIAVATKMLLSEPSEIADKRFYEDLILKVNSRYASIMESLAEIIPDPDNQYTSQAYETCVKDGKHFMGFLESLEKAQEVLSRRKTELEHMKGHDKTKCPQCHHEWHLGYSESEYQRTLKDLEELSEREVKTKASLKETQELQELIVNRTNWRRAFTSHVEYIDDDRHSLKHYLTSKCDYNKEPAKARLILEDFLHDLTTISEISRKRGLLEDQQKILNKIIEVKSGDIQTATKHLTDSEAELVKAVTQQRELNGELNLLTECEKALKLLKRAFLEVSDKYDSVVKINDDLLLIEEQKILNNMIRELRLKISSIELSLNDAKNQELAVAKLEKEIEEKVREEALLIEAMKSLSPTEGIIAKSLISFMDQFVSNMNLFIKEIWSYPLVIQSLLKSGDDIQELDFKFSVSADGNKPVPDVALGSTGQRDIFNMSFKIVSLEYSGLTNGPIYLDEFGNALDEKHRVTAQRALLELMQSSNFSQVFMISHDRGSYGNLRNTDVNVICSRNISIGEGEVYNVNMKTTREVAA